MKKLLITGFEPFGGEKINPSWEAVSRLSDEIGGYTVTKLLLPVTFAKAAERVIDAAIELHPDVIISVGQAGGRKSITPELVAIMIIVCRKGEEAFSRLIKQPSKKTKDDFLLLYH